MRCGRVGVECLLQSSGKIVFGHIVPASVGPGFLLRIPGLGASHSGGAIRCRFWRYLRFPTRSQGEDSKMFQISTRKIVPATAAFVLGVAVTSAVAGTPTTTTLPESCTPTPQSGCLQAVPGKASIQIKMDAAKPHKSALKYNWNKGEEVVMDLAGTGQDDFYNPVAGASSMALCLYDGNTLLSTMDVFPGGQCGNKPCWKLAGNGRGYGYKNKEATPHGITSIKMKSGEAGKSKVSIAAKGILVPPVELPATDNITAQFIIDSFPNLNCFSTEFPAELIQKNTDSQFKAKGPVIPQ